MQIVSNIKNTSSTFGKKFKEAATSETAKKAGVAVAVGTAGAVGLGAAYAVFAATANKVYSALS